MSLVNRTNTNIDTVGSDFIIAGDDYLQEYIKEIDQPKQSQSPPEIPDDSEFEEIEEVEQKEPSRYVQKRGQTTARFAVSTIDKILSSMVAVYANSDNPEEFKAEQEDIDDLAEQLSVYFSENNLDLPPWVFALITTGFIIQKKFKGVGSVRKINIERRKYKVEIESLKLQNELLNSKNQMLELKKKVEEMEQKTV